MVDRRTSQKIDWKEAKEELGEENPTGGAYTHASGCSFSLRSDDTRCIMHFIRSLDALGDIGRKERSGNDVTPLHSLQGRSRDETSRHHAYLQTRQPRHNIQEKMLDSGFILAKLDRTQPFYLARSSNPPAIKYHVLSTWACSSQNRSS